MEVFALVGPSGSGKSHRALLVANSLNVPLVIDDGLLIKGNKILAGKSAKREPSKLAAVRRAIFLDKDHSKDVRKVIETLPDQRILILGTSENMVRRIASELELPEIQRIIQIDEIASVKEMDQAKEQRLKHGKHVIPVPMIEVKPKFSGYLMESLELVLGIKDKQTKTEKTIVRPRFSYYGKLLIHDSVITQLITYGIKKHRDVVQVTHLDTGKTEEGITINASVDCYYGRLLPIVGEEIQAQVKETMEMTTGLNVLAVNINFSGLRLPKANIHQ